MSRKLYRKHGRLYKKYPWLLDLEYPKRKRACEYCWFFESLGRQPPEQLIKEKFSNS